MFFPPTLWSQILHINIKIKGKNHKKTKNGNNKNKKNQKMNNIYEKTKEKDKKI